MDCVQGNNDEKVPSDTPDELKTPKQFKVSKLLDELRKKSLLIHQIKPIERFLRKKRCSLKDSWLKPYDIKRRETMKSKIALAVVDNPELSQVSR